MLVKSILGVLQEERNIFEDKRGTFRRIYTSNDFNNETSGPRQISFSHNINAFTLRGMHGFTMDVAQTKIVECVAGALFDVVVDLRWGSETYLDHVAYELDSATPYAISIPPGCLHGYLTLKDNTSIIYRMAADESSEREVGLKWNDEQLAIVWPHTPKLVSTKDSTWPELNALRNKSL